MKVHEIMTTDVRACGPEAKLSDAALIMWENDCGIVPVTNDAGQCVGIITDRDICMAVATRNRLASDLTVGEVSAGKVLACPPDADVSAVLELMRREQLRRVPVADKAGRLVGIISIADVIRHAKRGPETKKARHVPHKEVMRTLKALMKPAPPLEEDDDDTADDVEDAHAEVEAAVAADDRKL